MRRLGRVALNLLTGASLLLCAAAVAWWVRSYRTCDLLVVTRLDRAVAAVDMWGGDRRRGWRLEVASLNGGVGLEWSPYAASRLAVGPPGFTFVGSTGDLYGGGWKDPAAAYPGAARNLQPGVWHDPASGSWAWRWRGFMAAKGRAPYAAEVAATIPHGAVAGLMAALPLARVALRLLRAVRRRRRAAAGRCVGCGYDLRATPGQCPECGRPRA